MFFNFGLAALPEELFQSGGVAKTPDLDRIVLYATSITKFEPLTFKGLTKLRILTFVNNRGFGEDNFDTVDFSDLVSLEHFVSSSLCSGYSGLDTDNSLLMANFTSRTL